MAQAVTGGSGVNGLRQGDNLLCILNLIIEFYLLFALYLFLPKGDCS